ncbi:hypothetical protein BBJ28_00010512 [Nothophytophthora sp. Chile5]|nr:hypothetical protein BBJ28_00010512 [Nothophytophthora sp. Chile5]
MAYTICISFEPHKMRDQLLQCTSEACKAAVASPCPCPWRGKLLICFDTSHTSIYQAGAHFTDAHSPKKKKKLTKTQKSFCREMAAERMKSMRLRQALARKFDVSIEALPELSAIQNYVNNYSRSNLDNHDRVKEITHWIHERAWNGSETDTQPFTFSWELDQDGTPQVGDGSDERPFFLLA